MLSLHGVWVYGVQAYDTSWEVFLTDWGEGIILFHPTTLKRGYPTVHIQSQFIPWKGKMHSILQQLPVPAFQDSGFRTPFPSNIFCLCQNWGQPVPF